MSVYDVIIIGTGPSGGMAACILAETGLSVLILEKEILPRSKPCGGGLPLAVQSIINWDFSEFVEAHPKTVRYLFNYDETEEINQPVEILMVDRSRFDLHFIERAVRLGSGSVQVRESATVTGVEEKNDGITVCLVGGDKVYSEYLIAADGAFSNTAKWLGIDCRQIVAAAIDVEIEVDPEIFEKEANRATFNFGCIPHGNGYGWIFPKNGTLTCGVASWRGKPQLQKTMRTFMERSFPAGNIRYIKRTGHPIPLYAGRKQIATPRVCLVGDAASLVDPIMGEGIRFALQSGKMAGRVIADLKAGLIRPGERDTNGESEIADCRQYESWIQKTIGRDLDALYRVITPIYMKDPGFFYRKFFREGENYFALSKELLSRISG